MVKKSDFQSRILPLWWSEIKLWFGWTDILNAVIRTGGHIFGLWFAFFLTGNLEDLIGSIAFEVGRSLVIISLLYLILLVTYSRASHKLYDQQKQMEHQRIIEIEKLEHQLFPVDSIAYEIDNNYRDAEGNQIISIKVTNLTSFDLVCFASATYILKWMEAGRVKNEDLTYMTHPGSFFSWSGGSDRGLKNIYQTVPERINIADGKQRAMRFLLQNNMDYFEQYANATFILNLEIGGRLSDGRRIKTVPFIGTLEFHKAMDQLVVWPNLANGDRQYPGGDTDGNTNINLDQYVQYDDISYRLLFLKEGDSREKKE